VRSAKGYSYLSATMESTFVVRRAGYDKPAAWRAGETQARGQGILYCFFSLVFLSISCASRRITLRRGSVSDHDDAGAA
jgi:hypothetical protein